MIRLELWLYGPMARFGGTENRGSHALLRLEVPPGTRMSDILARLAMPLAEKGITFINGQLTDMPGLGADLDWEFKDGDRIGFFHRQSMWPFQYRFGAVTGAGLREAMGRREDRGILHSSAAARDRGAEGDPEGGEAATGIQ